MLIPSIIFFLLLSALFSGTEIAFISASKLRIELLKKKKARRATILAGFYEKTAEFLGTMLVGNNIALVAFTSLMTLLLSDLIPLPTVSEELRLFIYTVLMTIVVLIFGEFLPKTLFRLYANNVLYFLAYPLQFLRLLFTIPAWFMISISNFLLKILFKTPVEDAKNVFTRRDLENFIKSSHTDNDEDIDKDLFEKALHLKEVRVRDCMIPRPEIEHIDISESLENLEKLLIDTNLSRILVIKDDIDEVLGYVHHQQLLEKPKTIRKIILDIPFVPEVMKARELMNMLITRRLNIACVVDEFGGTAGIITLEDILEEIFGEIADEHDQEEYVETQLSEHEYRFSGRLEISYLNEKYEQLDFPEDEYSTLSGYLVMTTQTIPEQGAEITLDGYKFILELVSDTKIETVRVVKETSKHEDK